MTGRGLRGRRAGRAIIVETVLVLLLFGMLIAAGPATSGGEPPSSVVWLTGAGIVGIVIGLAWMIRINHADPEAHGSFFRSHRR
jgi:hypothetical protein